MKKKQELDWDNLKLYLDKLQKIVKSNFHNTNSDEILKFIYLIETDLDRLKKDLCLPRLDPSIYSESVVKGLSVNYKHADFFGAYLYDPFDFLRAVDYQYWLLIFLLTKNNYIYYNHTTLVEIIDDFIEMVKDESFSFKDIVITSSGATRCKTNLRFAFKDLKTMGLVINDQKYKDCWRLTFLGFFTAASFCLNPMDQSKQPFSMHITPFSGRKIFGSDFNLCIIERLLELSDPEEFSNLVRCLGLQDDDCVELKKGSEIFGSYGNFLAKQENDKKKSTSKNDLVIFLTNLNNTYNLSTYMEELSEKFNGDAFIRNLINKAFR